MKVGQVWEDRTGGKTTIMCVTHVGTQGYPVLGRDESGGEYEFTIDGVFSAPSKLNWDLVRLVEDVAPQPAIAASRLYVAGPMTGYPALNFPAFNAAAAHYRSLGFTVVNPAEINGEDPNIEWIPGSPELAAHWAKCMRADITALLTCDKIVMLDGWLASRGATLERHVALTLGMEVLHHGV